MPFDLESAVETKNNTVRPGFDLSSAVEFVQNKANENVGYQPQLNTETPQVDKTQYLTQGNEHTNLLQKARLFIENFTGEQQDYEARQANVKSLARDYSSEHNVPIEDANKIVSGNYDDIIAQKYGIYTAKKQLETELQIAGTALGGYGLVTAPIATLAGIGTFAIMDKLIPTKELIPEGASDSTRMAVDLIDFIAKAKLAHEAFKAAPGLLEAFTTQKIFEYNLPRTITLSGEQVRDIYQTGELTTPEEVKLFSSLGLTGEKLKTAINNGVNIEIPTEKLIHTTDTPLWAKIKNMFGRGIYKSTVSEMQGEPRQGVTGFLPSPVAPEYAMAGGMTNREIPPQIAKWMEKGITVTERQAPIRIVDPEAKIKDINGNIVDLPKGHEMTPYKLSNGNIWLHDGKDVIVNSGQLQNLANKNLVLGTKEVPEESGIEEVVKGGEPANVGNLRQAIQQTTENHWVLGGDYSYHIDKKGNQFVVDRTNPMTDEITTYDQAVSRVGSYYSLEDAKSAVVSDALQNKPIQVGKTKFSQYQLPGGENYREVLFTNPIKETKGDLYSKRFEEIRQKHGGVEQGEKFLKVQTPEERAELSRLAKEADVETELVKNSTFKSSHWSEPNVISHARLNDRITPDGKKILFIEEIQSDWAREERKEGTVGDISQAKKELGDYDTALRQKYNAKTFGEMMTRATEAEKDKLQELGNKVDSIKPTGHPLLKSWQEFTLKRILKKAVAEGYDGIAWTTGEQQAERYDLSKAVDSVGWTEWPAAGEGKGILTAYKDGKEVIKETILPSEIDKYIGKDKAKKLLEQVPEKATGRKILQGEDLKVGGEWAKNLYDKQIPNILKDLTKGEVKDTEIVTKVNKGAFSMRNEPGAEGVIKDINETITQPYLPITPQIRARVLGQPMAGGMTPEQPSPENVSPDIEGKTPIQRKLAAMNDRLSRVAIAKETLNQLEVVRGYFKGAIQKYKDEYMKEELQGVPGYYITKKGGMKPDEVLDQLRENFGIDLADEMELKEYLRDIENSRKELIADIEANKPQFIKHKETTLLKQQQKAAEQAKKATDREALVIIEAMDKAFEKSLRRAKIEGREAAKEERKVAYFGENISKAERSALYLMAKSKGLYYTDYKGKSHDKLQGILKFYRGATFDQFKTYISNLNGTADNPPVLFKLYGDITKDTEALKILNAVSEGWQDINKLEMVSLDPARIVEKVSGKDIWDDNILADNTFNVLVAADDALFDRKAIELAELDKNRAGIKVNSKESVEVMRKFEAKEPLTEKEQKVVDFLRSKYDALIQEANTIRAQIGKKPIAYRQDYMTHIIEQNILFDFFKGDEKSMENISNDQLNAIRKGDYTKGYMPFNRFAQQRLGNKTKLDAIGNYQKYLNVILREIYYAPALWHARKFNEYALMKQPNAYMAMDRLFNDLKGKESIMDKTPYGVVAGNKYVKTARGLLAKSALLANVNFWAVNTSNFTISYDELGWYMNKGLEKFLGSKEWRDFAFKNSTMLKSRAVDPDLDPSGFKSLEKAMGFITNLIEFNNVGSTFVGAYFKAVEEMKYGKPQALKYADTIARRTQAGYKKFELNAWMRSNSGMLLSQFQTWSFNAMNHLIYDIKLGNIPKNIRSIFTKEQHKPVRWGAFFTLIAVAYAVNTFYKAMGVREPYKPEAAVPNIPFLTTSRYEEPGMVQVMRDIESSVTSKKKSTRKKALKRSMLRFVPGGTQVGRFLEGRFLPENKDKKKR